MKTILSAMLRARTALVGLMAVSCVIFFSSPLHGQSMDYGALEQLFKEPVTTSVDGSPERVSDVPATMEIITADEIRRSGAKDIPGVLRHVGGVDTMEWGNDNTDVSVRGYDQALAERLLVLVDGRQVYADHYGYTPWSTVPVELSEIRQIEIIKGPSSALFGFNAVGGVINIITYNPLYDDVNMAQFSAGTQDLAAGVLAATHKFGNRAAVLLDDDTLHRDYGFTSAATSRRTQHYQFASSQSEDIARLRGERLAGTAERDGRRLYAP
jgi:outer membrane receptor for ferrienterochelin and colicins